MDSSLKNNTEVTTTNSKDNAEKYWGLDTAGWICIIRFSMAIARLEAFSTKFNEIDHSMKPVN